MVPVPTDLPGPLLEALQRSNRALDLDKIAAAYAFAAAPARYALDRHAWKSAAALQLGEVWRLADD
jgi:hypothetical protein